MAETPYDRILRMQQAIDNIAPWLSASLSEQPDACKEYKKACYDIFALDSLPPPKEKQ